VYDARCSSSGLESGKWELGTDRVAGRSDATVFVGSCSIRDSGGRSSSTSGALRLRIRSRMEASSLAQPPHHTASRNSTCSSAWRDLPHLRHSTLTELSWATCNRES
jgi:hypothetical protein